MSLLLLLCALAGFSANSLLTRGALGGGHLDAMAFMAIRLLSGAAVLTLIVRWRSGGAGRRGSWGMAVALAVYALAFTLAYTRIAAGPGALLLFGAVHLTMFGSGLWRGERPTARQWIGTVLAAAGLVVLTAPGWQAPDGIGALLMLTAGVAWGLYSLAGRTRADPLATTADNFARAAVMCLPIAWAVRDAPVVSPIGVTLAVASGAVASGLAYAAWYAVLPRLEAWRAALVQLAVPVVTAVAAVAVLTEPMHARHWIALGLSIGGIGLATGRAAGARPATTPAPASRPDQARAVRSD